MMMLMIPAVLLSITTTMGVGRIPRPLALRVFLLGEFLLVGLATNNHLTTGGGDEEDI
jgi:hypothetical protein